MRMRDVAGHVGFPLSPSPQNVDEFCGDKTSGRRSQRTECHRDPTTHTRCSTNIHLYEASNNNPTNTTNIHTNTSENRGIEPADGLEHFCYEGPGVDIHQRSKA